MPLPRSALFVALALVSGSPLLAATPPVPPDLTLTNAVDRELTYNLGATGLRGWIDCPKSKRIFDKACQALEKEPLNQDWTGAINGLALLATGNPEYVPRVREFARKPRAATAAKAEPGLKELITQLNEQCRKGEFPAGELNNRRVTAVEEAIKAIETATEQPELRSIAGSLPKP